jgi:uncharacterized membrane protein
MALLHVPLRLSVLAHYLRAPEAITAVADNGAFQVIGIHPNDPPHYTVVSVAAKLPEAGNGHCSQPRRSVMTKSLMQAIVIAVAITAPIVASAQESPPVMRAQVKGEIAQLEKFGYSPAGSDIDYPSSLMAAESRVGAQDSSATTTAYGGKVTGSIEVGSRAAAAHTKSLYLEKSDSLYIGD